MSYLDINMFDPRLVEYLKKKEYYKKQKMTPCIPLEIEYAITDNDLKKIQRYEKYKGKKIVQKIQLPNETTEFPVFEPNIQYKNPFHYENIISQESTKMKHNPDFNPMLKYLNKKTEIPAFLSQYIHKNKSDRVYKEKNINECVNQIREEYLADQTLNPDILNDLILGMPDHTKKSYGYNDAFEHYFDYVDNDKQKEDHVVLPFPRGGISCRLENSKQKSREILP
jgi:hypothetical protein